jgi:hypothetical protein
MNDHSKYLGRQAKDLPRELVDELLEKGYSISPKSGRLRKKHHKKKLFYERRAFKKGMRTTLILLLIGLFIASLVIIMPHLTPQQKPSTTKQKK